MILLLLLVSANAVSAVYLGTLNQGMPIYSALSSLLITKPALSTITWLLLATTMGGLAFFKRQTINAPIRK
jgi:hypothetical protein